MMHTVDPRISKEMSLMIKLFFILTFITILQTAYIKEYVAQPITVLNQVLKNKAMILENQAILIEIKTKLESITKP